MSTINCFIPAGKLEAFEAFASTNGHATRPHSSLYVNGMQVKVGQHWMAVVWNKNWKRYTADIRLKQLVDAFTK
jgi:hypothetical protein